MKPGKLVAVALGVGVLLLVGLYFAMAERVEVVVLHTRDAAGADHATRIWVVDLEGRAYLRTGANNQTWLLRLRDNPTVELERGGTTAAHTATALGDSAVRDQVNQLMLEKYGWSEQLLRAVGSDPAAQVAIRLDPS